MWQVFEGPKIKLAYFYLLRRTRLTFKTCEVHQEVKIDHRAPFDQLLYQSHLRSARSNMRTKFFHRQLHQTNYYYTAPANFDHNGRLWGLQFWEKFKSLKEDRSASRRSIVLRWMLLPSFSTTSTITQGVSSVTCYFSTNWKGSTVAGMMKKRCIHKLRGVREMRQDVVDSTIFRNSTKASPEGTTPEIVDHNTAPTSAVKHHTFVTQHVTCVADVKLLPESSSVSPNHVSRDRLDNTMQINYSDQRFSANWLCQIWTLSRSTHKFFKEYSGSCHLWLLKVRYITHYCWKKICSEGRWEFFMLVLSLT